VPKRAHSPPETVQRNVTRNLRFAAALLGINSVEYYFMTPTGVAERVDEQTAPFVKMVVRCVIVVSMARLVRWDPVQKMAADGHHSLTGREGIDELQQRPTTHAGLGMQCV
jgi:hypothetical protein